MRLQAWARWIEQWARPATGGMSAVAGLALVCMMFWVVTDVVSRYVFNRPILGSYEVVEYTMVVFIFMAFAYAQFSKTHITVPIVVERFGPRTQAVFHALTGVVTLGIAVAMIWGASKQTGNMVTTHITSTVLLIPKWPFQLITAIGLVAFFVAKVVDVLDCFSRIACARGSSGEQAEELRTI